MKVCPQVFISLFRRATGETKELIAFCSTAPTIGLTDIRGDRSCSGPQLSIVQELPVGCIDQRVDLIDDTSRRIEDAERVSHP